MKILVVTATGNRNDDTEYGLVVDQLNDLGIPYDELILLDPALQAKYTTLPLVTASTYVGKYYAVILTHAKLAYR